MTELDIRIAELQEKIREINSISRDELPYEEANGLDSALADVQGELNELYKQKEIVDHLRY